MPNYQRLNGVGIAGYLGDVTGGVKRELQRSISQSQTGEKVSGLTRQDKSKSKKAQFRKSRIVTVILFLSCI